MAFVAIEDGVSIEDVHLAITNAGKKVTGRRRVNGAQTEEVL